MTTVNASNTSMIAIVTFCLSHEQHHCATTNNVKTDTNALTLPLVHNCHFLSLSWWPWPSTWTASSFTTINSSTVTTASLPHHYHLAATICTNVASNTAYSHDVTAATLFWCSKTMKRWPCWCTETALWEFYVKTFVCLYKLA